MAVQNTKAGIILMLGAVFTFAVQDGVSRLLADKYNVYLIVMIRYWFFALFVTVMAARSAGAPPRGRDQPAVPAIVPGVILIVEVLVTIYAFVVLGLIPTHAIFASYPLMIAALSGPVLGKPSGRAGGSPSGWGSSASSSSCNRASPCSRPRR